MCTERSHLHRNRRQTVRANRSVLVFPRFWKLKLGPKELYDPIADVLANGAFAGNETNGTAPSSLLYKRGPLRSLVQPSLGFVLETLNVRNSRRTIPHEVGSILPRRRIDQASKNGENPEYFQLSHLLQVAIILLAVEIFVWSRYTLLIKLICCKCNWISFSVALTYPKSNPSDREEKGSWYNMKFI